MSEPAIQALIVRALKTFLQTFIGAVVVAWTPAMNLSTARALLISAGAAGVSAVMNLYLKPVEAK